jgi:type IV pilus assembly protein PilQ
VKKGIRSFCLVSFVGALAAGSPAKKDRSTPTPTPSTASAGRDSGEKISLDLKDADLKDVLATFAKLEKLNIAVDPEVHGSVTVRLHDVPWDQALELILRSNGLGYLLENNILRVGPPAKLAGQ